jgi:lipoprotein NlpI
MELHVLLAGVEFGPYSDDKARELLGEGFLSESDPAKRLNETDWLPLSNVLGTQPASSATPAASAPKPQDFIPFFTESTEESEPTEMPVEADDIAAPAEALAEPEPHEEEPASAVVQEKPIEVAKEKEEPQALSRPATSSLSESARPATQPIPAPEEIKSSFVKALAATRSIAAITRTTGAAPPFQASIPTRIVDSTPLLQTSPPARAAEATPLLQVSVPARSAKKTMVTGSLLAMEALHAARDRSGILPPIRQTLGRMTAPVPEFDPEPAPPRKRVPLVLGEREASAPQPPQRKAIRLTGRITLPGIAPQIDRLVSPTQTADTGAGMVARLSRADIEPAAEVKSAPLQLRERKDPNLLKPQVRKAIRLTDPISLPGRATQPTPPAVPITEAKAPAEEIPSWPAPTAPPAEAQAPTDEIQSEPAPEPTAPPVESHSPAPVLERTAELAAAASLAAEVLEKAGESKEPDLTSSGTLSGSGHLLSSGELAERRSLKVTGALKHTLPPRQPIQLSSPSGDSSRLPLPGDERALGATLSSEIESEKLPPPPVPEEDLPNRAPTGKIPVSEMPTEGVKIRRRITTKIPLPHKPTEAILHESPPRRLPPPLPRQSVETPEIATPADSFTTPPSAGIDLDVPPPVELAGAPVEEAPQPEIETAEQVVEPPPAVTEEAAPPAPSAARPEQVRLRRPVKLELSSRAKIQDSGRLTLEAFSKMASLELPPATPKPVALAATAAETMPTEPEPEMPEEPPSVEPAAFEPESSHDFSAVPLSESPPIAWRPHSKKKGDRSFVWMAYVIIALGVVSVLILFHVHRASVEQAAESFETPTPTPTPSTTPPSTPSPSASPPPAASAPASAAPPPATPAPAPTAPAAPAQPTPPATAATPATPPAAPVPATPPSSPAQDIARQAGAFVSDGILKYQSGDFDGAIAAYNQAIDLNPKSAEAFFNRGIAKAAHDDLDGAVADYSQALLLEPTLGAAYYYRGLARHSKAELDGAFADYNQAIQLDPKNALAYFNRGLIRMQKDDIDGAIVDSTRALELDPHLIQSYYDRGLGRLAKGAMDGALSDMKTFCQLAPQDGYTDYARLYIWLIQTQQNQLAEANQDLTTAMNSGWNGGPDSMVTRIGEFLLGQIGENDLLKASASAIPIKDQGQRCEAWYFIGMRKLEAGDKDAAIEALRKCVATQKVDYCEYILAQEALKSLGGGAVPPAPRAQAVSLPDPGTMAPPPSAPAPQ